MNAHASIPDPAGDDAAERRAAWASRVLERQVDGLEQLAAAALELALFIKDQAVNDPETNAQSREAAARSFARVSRAMRLTGQLQAKLLTDLQRIASWNALSAANAREAAQARAAEQRAALDPAYGHKARVEAVVARMVKAETEDEDKIERLIAEASERLDDPDIYGDVLSRPVGQLVALICRDLDLRPDWTRLAEEAWAREEIARRAPGSPFERFFPPDDAHPP